MQATGGLINDIIVLAILIYLILLVNGKVKLKSETQEKLKDLLSRRGTIFKTLMYSGAIIFLILILIQLFGL